MKPKPLPDLDLLRGYFEYDPSSGEVKLKKKTSQRTPAGTIVGSRSSNGYLKVSLGGESYPLARVIWKLVTGEEPKGIIDHINRVRNDNRWENLRDVDPTVNALNRSDVKGYCQIPNGRYRATLQQKDLGYFDSEEDANRVYEVAREELLNESLRV